MFVDRTNSPQYWGTGIIQVSLSTPTDLSSFFLFGNLVWAGCLQPTDFTGQGRKVLLYCWPPRVALARVAQEFEEQVLALR